MGRPSPLAYFLLIAVILIIYFKFLHEPYDDLNLPNRKMYTSLGPKTLKQLNRDVYRPLGYEITDWCDFMPCVSKIKPIQCSQVFKEWLEIAGTYDPKAPPRQKLTEKEISDYTLQRHYTISYAYWNDKFHPKEERTWNESYVNNLIAKIDKSPTDVLHYYHGTAEAVYYATKFYDIREKVGLVLGTIYPWAESYILKNGAKKVLTIDYNEVNIGHPQMGFKHAIEFAKDHKNNIESVDFVVSFSSLEHSGLGRYGDPMDPIGDRREVEKVHCWLKPGGLFFLGIPTGNDHLTFNAHRFYGPLRLSLLTSGFKLLNIFNGPNKGPYKFSEKDFANITDPGQTYVQMVFVLQKI